jgi:hypothetical protein
MQRDELTTTVDVREQLRRVFEEGAPSLTPNPASRANDVQSPRAEAEEEPAARRPRPRRPTLVVWTDHHEEAAFETARVASIATAEEEHRRRDLEHWDTTGIMAPDIFHPFPIPFPMPMGLRAIFTTAAAPRAAHLAGGEWATQLVPAHPHPADAPELQCSVCLDVVAAESTVKTLPCAHTFHAGCIDTWLMRRASCPCCREPIEQAC